MRQTFIQLYLKSKIVLPEKKEHKILVWKFKMVYIVQGLHSAITEAFKVKAFSQEKNFIEYLITFSFMSAFEKKIKLL